jgi:hypothetical protein
LTILNTTGHPFNGLAGNRWLAGLVGAYSSENPIIGARLVMLLPIFQHFLLFCILRNASFMKKFNYSCCNFAFSPLFFNPNARYHGRIFICDKRCFTS